MNNITIHNYETYFLDYFEKQLPEDKIRELFAFLDENPELKEEFYDFEMIYLQDQNMPFPEKESLLAEENTEENIIAFLEGDLSPESREEIRRKITHNPIYNSEYQYYKHTKLTPPDMVYEPKEKLKKKAVVLFYPYGIAATLLLLLGLSFYWFKITDTDTLHELQTRDAVLISAAENTPRIRTKNIFITPVTPPAEKAANIEKTVVAKLSGKKKRYEISPLNIRETEEIPLVAYQPGQAIPGRMRLTPSPFKREGNKTGILRAIAFAGKSYLHKLGYRLIRKNRHLLDIDVANTLVKEYNRLTDNDIQLVRIRDDSDKVIAFYIANDRRRLFKYKKK